MLNRIAEHLDADPELDPERLLDRYIGDERAHSWRAGVALGFVIGVVAGVLAAICFWPRAGDAMPTKLVFTIPDRGQNCYKIVGEQGDSVTFCECGGTAPISAVTRSYLYAAPLSGGGFQLYDSLMYLPIDAVEGTQDTFPVPFPGNFYVRFRNNVGVSCESNIIAVIPDVTTGVEADPVDSARVVKFPPVRPTWHDVTGRRVDVPRGTGIFFQRVKMPDRKVYARRVFVRASRPYSFGRWRPQ